MFVLIGLFKQKLFLYFLPVLRIRIRDPASFDPWDPGWEKNQDPDPDEYFGSYFRELRNNFLGYRTFIVLKFFHADANSDPRIFLTLDPGSGI